MLAATQVQFFLKQTTNFRAPNERLFKLVSNKLRAVAVGLKSVLKAEPIFAYLPKIQQVAWATICAIKRRIISCISNEQTLSA